MTVPSHLQATQTARKLHQTVSKTSRSTKRFSKQFLATSCHFKHPPAKVVKGQTQKGHRPSLSSSPKHSKNENSLKKQAPGEPYAVHVRYTLLFTQNDSMGLFQPASPYALHLRDCWQVVRNYKFGSAPGKRQPFATPNEKLCDIHACPAIWWLWV